MAEENQAVAATESQVNQEAQNHEPSPVETEARGQGWVPKEEFTGEENKWIDADEFVRRRPLFEKIDRQNREIKEVRRTLTELAAHHAQVKENALKEAIETLKAKKEEAFIDGDAKQIVKLDEELADAKAAQAAHKQEQVRAAQQVAQEIHPEFEAWTKRNPWYNEDEGMKAYADAKGRSLYAGGKSREEVLRSVEQLVRAEFKHKFVNQNREKPGAVEGSSKSTGKAGSIYTPTALEKQVAARFVRQGVFKSEDEYYKQLKDLNKENS